jgi:serine/threonine protein kinase
VSTLFFILTNNSILFSKLREVLIWKKLNHPNILPFLGLTKFQSDEWAIVTPLQQNGDLLGFINTKRPQSAMLVRIFSLVMMAPFD